MNALKKIAIGRQYNERNGFQPWCKRVWIDAVKMKVRGERCWGDWETQESCDVFVYLEEEKTTLVLTNTGYRQLPYLTVREFHTTIIQH